MSEGTGGNILKSFPNGSNSERGKFRMVLVSFVIVVSGLLTGYFLSRAPMGGNKDSQKATSSEVTITQDEAGVGDDSSFPDTAQGILVEGGIKGEGTHHLERPGGVSQNVYLTSTIINLQSFVGKKVEVRGQTLSAITAGWLMDVGKIKVIN